MHELVIIVAQYGIIVPVVGYAALVAYRKRQYKELLLFSLVSIGITIVLIKIATTLHSDPRPFVRDGVHPYFTSSTDNGFPSDHTTFSALIAWIVFKYYRLGGATLVLVAGLIGAARVIAGVHHGQDVIAGIIIAAVSVYVAHVITKRIGRYYRQRLHAN